MHFILFPGVSASRVFQCQICMHPSKACNLACITLTSYIVNKLITFPAENMLTFEGAAFRVITVVAVVFLFNENGCGEVGWKGTAVVGEYRVPLFRQDLSMHFFLAT